MSNPYIGEIRMVAFGFAPSGFAVCNGQLLQIRQNSALFAILGVNYGGDGQTTFALPDFQSRAPMHWGTGSGLTPRMIGEVDGTPSVTLIVEDLPTHDHGLQAAGLTPPNPAQNVAAPTSQAMIGPSNPNMAFSDVATPVVSLSALAIGLAGGSQSHENRQPLLALMFVIALQGVFPSRN